MAHLFNRMLYSIKDRLAAGRLKNLDDSHKYRFEQKEKFRKECI